MKTAVLAAAWLTCSWDALATFPGAKADVVRGSATRAAETGSGLMPLLQLALAVGVIALFLKVWLPKWISRWNRGISATPGGGIKVEESATFAGGTLYVVKVRSKTLLLSCGSNGVACLADISDPAPQHSGPAAFVDLLDATQRALREAAPRHVGNAAEPACGESVEHIEAAIARARNLAL